MRTHLRILQIAIEPDRRRSRHVYSCHIFLVERTVKEKRFDRMVFCLSHNENERQVQGRGDKETRRQGATIVWGYPQTRARRRATRDVRCKEIRRWNRLERKRVGEPVIAIACRRTSSLFRLQGTVISIGMPSRPSYSTEKTIYLSGNANDLRLRRDGKQYYV